MATSPTENLISFSLEKKFAGNKDGLLPAIFMHSPLMKLPCDKTQHGTEAHQEIALDRSPGLGTFLSWVLH